MARPTNCEICGVSLVQPSRGGCRRVCESLSCQKERQRAWDKKYDADGRKKNRNLKARYGISLEEYEAMMTRCGRRCEACGGLPASSGIKTQQHLHVDHDHQTGRVRGILCHSCNLALGYAQEDPSRLIGLVEYILTHSASEVEADMSIEVLQ